MDLHLKKKIEDFLRKNQLIDYKIIQIAGDASFRSYYRIETPQKTVILMYAPPEHEDLRPFVKVECFLLQQGFSAPNIFDIDYENGFMLLEDLGDDLYSRVLARATQKERITLEFELYKKACDCLIALHQIDSETTYQLSAKLKFYNHAQLFREVMLFVEWYLPLRKNRQFSSAEKKTFKALWFELFDQISKQNQVLVLRDYHADNLLVLKGREGHKQVGLLDFQDALLGSKAYDLVSMLEDARRDIDKENQVKILDYYLQKSGCDHNSFLREYEILSLQRNLKILGIFCRLSKRDNKHQYINLLPRVINFVKMRLETKSDVLANISNFIKDLI